VACRSAIPGIRQITFDSHYSDTDCGSVVSDYAIAADIPILSLDTRSFCC